MSDLPIISEEEQELHKILSRINAYPKLSAWVRLFLDVNNKETYGNRTQSAIKAYSLDPETQYFSAATIGKENFKKLQIIASEYYEKTGMTAGKQLDLLASKAVTTTNAKYLITLLEITGVYQPKAAVAIQNNIQINNDQISAEEAKKFSNDFEQFINAKYSKPSNQQDSQKPTG